MITRRGRTVLEDIRAYWGEMTEQASDSHRAGKKQSVPPDGAALAQRLSGVDHRPVVRRTHPA
jgi:hypothetical protein